MRHRAEPHAYRVLWVNDANGVDAISEPFRASCDFDAVLRAAHLAGGDEVELWSGTRFVARLSREDQEPQADMRTPAMSVIERVMLVDAAMLSGKPELYLSGLQSAFEAAGRADDTLLIAVLRALFRTGEIETVMCMRAEWQGRRASIRHLSR